MSHISNHTTALATALTLALTPLAGAAQGNSNNNNGNGNGNGKNGVPHNTANGQFCPPGLANRQPACVPPGQARRAYNEGERLDDTYYVLNDLASYGLTPGETYYVIDDFIYRVDPNTAEVLTVVGLLSDILN